ncbi:peroxisome proliferator-activated receptor gamma coactivator-related protein 1-like isoform X2 [Xiphias gladius]|uniref:peroxisome proliferator-activated receptor gamma coactivator-related protein 1-like isoform X2 n=1 Tax=Xiphias gladius TaxID=8245 RepID=UPI001A998F33|nr:peroxisome proliferator-activated receptor gamma coactivator-related protein 1-like isoform X2 [Xiphias gladius]
MWSGKMAARWRGKNGDLNADNSDFLERNSPNELVLSRGDVECVEMDTQSCTDHSILAIFEDSTVASEGKSGVEEESQTLLSALTEMLDSVEDDDGTLSPFDILPDTSLLIHPECRGNSLAISLADRLRPRPKSTNLTFPIKRDGEKEDQNITERNSPPQLLTQQSQTLFHSKTNKEENEVEVFTSTSLVNLVKLMHPYCLKLHVEEGDKLRKNQTLFSQEEVWKYERPTEESDEEINVVSDDDEPVKETKGKEEGDVKRDDGKLLKSVLLNGNSHRAPPSREKKRVSFGPIQVASFNESAEKGLNEKNLTSGHTTETVSVPLNSTKALGNPAGSALEPQTTPTSEMNGDKAEILPPKGETKAKSLSLQQYRQLRQKRQPLVEKQRNYTTKWPSVSEPPKELPPILCLQGRRQNSCGPKTAHHYPDHTTISINHIHKPGYKTLSHRTSLPPRPSPSQSKPPSHPRCSGLDFPRPESKTISPAGPIPDVRTNPNANVPESKKSPAKKPTLLSSDPPNPVLLPMPVSQTTSLSTADSSSKSKVEFFNIDSDLESTAHLPKIQNESSAAFPQTQPSSLEPKPQVLLVNQNGTALLQEINDKFTEIASDVSSRPPALCPATTQTEPASECNKLQPHKYSVSPKKEPKTPQSPSPDPVRQIKCPSSTPLSAQPPCPANAPVPKKKEVLPKVPPSISSPEEPPSTLQVGCRAQSATSDSGIEAPDLTSLLEQFEETQAKVESVCENQPRLVSATRTANLQTEGRTELDRSQPAGSEKTSQLLPTPSVEPLEPSETNRTPKTLRNLPQFQTLECVDIPEPLGTEIILRTQQEQPARRKNPPSKAIQIIDPRPLPSKKTHISTSEPPAAHASPHTYSSVSLDHDYCAPVDHSLTSATQRSRAKPSILKDISKITNESQVTALDSCAAAEWKTQTSTGQTKSVLQHHSEQPRTRSESHQSTDRSPQFSDCSAAAGDGGASEDETAPCPLPTPPPSPPLRGREKRRYRRRSPNSDSSSSCSSSSSSSSSSVSHSPKRKKLRHKRSASSSCSSSPCRSVSHSPPRRYRLSYSRSRCSRSRSRSWSQSRSPSRSRSPSPRIYCRQWKDVYSRESRKLRREHEIRIQKLKAIDERRVVYVGRIRRSMTHDELRERFSQFGEVECVSLHFRDRGDHYGFVTFYNMEDAFAAIDNGGKLRKADELPFDICFGGRRQFCSSNYSDLDANRDADLSPAKTRFEDFDFDSLLKQAQRGLKR